MGVNTTHGYFYLPGYGVSGVAEKALYDAGQQVADTAIHNLRANVVYPQAYATGTGTLGDPWAGDCIDDAYTACPAGGTIYLRAGYYQLAGTLAIKKTINIIGEGMGKTFILTADANGIVIGKDYGTFDNITLKNFTIDADAQTSHEEGNNCIDASGLYDPVDYLTLENLELKNSGFIGADIFQCNYSLIKNIFGHDNYSHTIESSGNAAGTDIHNTFKNIYTWDNGSCGVWFFGNNDAGAEYTYNVFDNIHAWDNTNYGIGICNQKGAVLSNSSSSGSGKEGINLHTLTDCDIHDCVVNESEQHGITLNTSNNINFTNVIVKNSSADEGDNSGIRIDDCNDINFNSCQAYDDRGTALANYGIVLVDTNTNINLTNCKLSPNLTGEILGTTAGIVKRDMATFGTSVAGDVAYFDGTNWVRLAKGTAGQVLTMSTGASPEWATP